MIGRLRGTVVHRQPPFLLVDVNGVGYEVEATMGVFYGLPPAGAECTLYTHLVVRDDAHLLFGFASEAERALFRDLIKVNGVGARMALTILSGMSVEDFRRCVVEQDPATLTRLPGVGKKTAERLILDMRDRLSAQDGAGDMAAAVAPGAFAPEPGQDPVRDAVCALAALGYKPQEASRMVRSVDVTGKDRETIIRAALRAVVK